MVNRGKLGDVERLKAAEKSHHENLYAKEGTLAPIDVESFRRNHLQPCYIGNGNHYSENRWAFHRLIQERGGWQGKHVLDYVCGNGYMAVYFALTGAERVDGFDISETAIRCGRDRVERQGLRGGVELSVMDASDLQYPDDHFDLVIGTGALHHVIKYPNVFEDLHRVMKPGTQAFFMEGLADNPLFKLWWKLKGEVPYGDVPIFAQDIRGRSRMFSRVEIRGDTLLHASKRFVWRKNPGRWRRRILRSTHMMDQWLFETFPAMRRWGSYSYITLTK